MRPLRLVTWNIHGARDGRLDAVARTLVDLQPDIVALQEVDGCDDDASPLDLLARRTGLRPLPGPARLAGRRWFGNALLIRPAVRRAWTADLSVDQRERRAALFAIASVEGWRHDLVVVGAHLGLRASERLFQVRRLVAAIDGLHHRGPAVLLGDLNEWRLGAALKELRASFHVHDGGPSFPVRWPVLTLDRVALRRLTLHRCAVARPPNAAALSDHLPVVADVTPALDGATTAGPSAGTALSPVATPARG